MAGIHNALSGAYSASKFTATISTNQTALNLRTWAISAGWDGTSAAEITVSGSVYIQSTSAATASLTIDGSWPGGVTLINNGLIVGKGGAGNTSNGGAGNAGGNAISLGVSCSINNAGAIAGAGGGGGGGSGAAAYCQYVDSFAGGGGGAGGGAGGSGYAAGAAASSNPSIGTGGNGAGYTNQIFDDCLGYPIYAYSAGGGGGGWGGAGGRAGNNSAAYGTGGTAGNNGSNAAANNGSFGGAAGKCVNLNGYTVTWIATGTRYGAIS